MATHGDCKLVDELRRLSQPLGPFADGIFVDTEHFDNPWLAAGDTP